MVSDSLFSRIGVKYVDHIAMTTKCLESTLSDWMGVPSSRLLRGPNTNLNQGVRYAFVQLEGRVCIELLEPYGDNSPILEHVRIGGGAYHFCYAVDNIEASVRVATESDAVIVVSPVEDIAFDGRRICFMFHANHGLFELVETGRHTEKQSSVMTKMDRTEAAVSTGSSIDGDNRNRPGELEARLLKVIKKCFPEITVENSKEIRQGAVEAWSSLGHLQLIMSIEKEFDIDIEMEEIGTLISYDDLIAYLEQGI